MHRWVTPAQRRAGTHCHILRSLHYSLVAQKRPKKARGARGLSRGAFAFCLKDHETGMVDLPGSSSSLALKRKSEHREVVAWHEGNMDAANGIFGL